MRDFAERLGVIAVCAAMVCGCADDPKSSPEYVRNVSLAQARACRVVDSLTVDNQFSPDKDIERGAMRKAQARAIEMGGNAILIQSTSVTSSGIIGSLSVMTLKGQILACGPNVAGG